MRILQTMRESVSQILHFSEDDQWATDFVLCSLVASRLVGGTDLPWGLLIGPPSSGKTELLRVLGGLSYTFVTDEITSKALNSHMQGDSDKSLLLLIDDKVVLWPEYTTQINQNPVEASAVLATLRRAFDGEGVMRATGAGAKRIFSNFGLIAGCTASVDDFLLENGQLGDRFVKFRILRSRMSLDQESDHLDHVLDSAGSKDTWRAELKKMATRTLRRYANKVDHSTAIPAPIRVKLKDACIIASKARILPSKKKRFHDADVEQSSRLAQQIVGLGHARTILDGRSNWNHEDLRFIMRVLCDTLLPEASATLVHMYKRKGSATAKSIASGTHLPPERQEQILYHFRKAHLVDERSGLWWLDSGIRTKLTSTQFCNEFPSTLRRNLPC